jgi:hypothetical protein
MKPVLLLVALLLVAGCGEEKDPTPVDTGSSLTVPSADPNGPPPPVVARGAGEQQEALQGSYCWNNGCADMAGTPWGDLPDLGAAPTVEAGFASPGDWTVSLVERHRRCATYPVLLSPTGDRTYELTPSGPAGTYRLDVFIYPRPGGDTSGAFRWSTPGTAAAQAWAHLHQNTESSGGMGVVQVVLDGAAVDGDVHGALTVSGADGSETFHLVTYDAGCPGDRYVTLAPAGPTDRRVDGLGAGPFRYDVDVVVDRTRHRASATSGSRAEDTRLTFDPPLPG